MIYYASLLLAIMATAFGQFYYKKYSLSKQISFLVLAIVMFISAPVFSYLALKELSIDTVYMFTSLTILVVIGLSKYYLNEKIDRQKVIGILLILIGIIFYGI